MSISKEQGRAIIGALFAMNIVGVDSDGNTYGNERNAHFLDSVRVLFPDLPCPANVIRAAEITESPTDYRHERNKKRAKECNRIANILREIAESIDEIVEVPF